MGKPAEEDVTRLLAAMRAGKAGVQEELAALLYPQMKRIAQRLMRRERPDHTLQPTALVNEACLRLFGEGLEWTDRAHFVAVSAQVMRQILVDYARGRRAAKRGGGAQRVDLEVRISGENHSTILIALDSALKRLSELDERQGRIVELRFFGGLTDQEVAHVLGISERTVKRDWQHAKAWLYAELGT
jgi:RNA polymerase sigma-70 factor, ECF subfamily